MVRFLLLLAALGLTACDRKPAAPAPTRSSAAQPPVIDYTGMDPAIRKAIDDAIAAVKATPTADAWAELAMTLHAHGHGPDARTCYDEAHRLAPREPRWPYLAGAAIAADDAEAALPYFEKAADLSAAAGGVPWASEGSAQLARAAGETVTLRLAETLMQVDRLDDAERRFRHVLSRDEASARAQLGLGRLLLRKGDLEGALEWLTKAAADPRAAKAAHQLLAEALRRKGSTKEAEARRLAAQKIADREWGDPLVAQVMSKRVGLKAMLVQSDHLFGAEKYDESFKMLKQAVSEYPDSHWAWVLLGRSQIRVDDLAGAEASLNKALELDATSAEAMFRLAVVYYRQEKIKDAAALLRRAIEHKPDFTRAHMNLAQCQLLLRDAEGAVASYREALRYDPNAADAHAALGDVLFRMSDYEPARHHLEEALKLNPNTPGALDRLTQVKQKLAEQPKK